jgi:glutamine cyclotransferase
MRPAPANARPHALARSAPCLLACALACLLLLAARPALAGQASPLSNPDGPAPTQPASILSRLPHSAEAFTQGLLLHQGSLYESTGLYGQSSLRKTDPATGRVLARRDLPRRLFGEGLALCGTAPERLVQLTWREGVILTYDPASLRQTGEARLRGQGWGLACRGAELVLSDGTETLRFLNATTLAETGEACRVRDGARPVERLNELEWVNGWLLANIWGEDRLAVIRPGGKDGVWRVALWLDLAPLRRELSARAESANGVAFDPAGDGGKGALYLTGKRWDTLFVVALPTLMRAPPKRAGR